MNGISSHFYVDMYCVSLDSFCGAVLCCAVLSLNVVDGLSFVCHSLRSIMFLLTRLMLLLSHIPISLLIFCSTVTKSVFVPYNQTPMGSELVLTQLIGLVTVSCELW